MKSSKKDQVERALHEATGAVKELAGKLSDTEKVEAEGAGDKLAGRMQKRISQVKKVFLETGTTRILGGGVP